MHLCDVKFWKSQKMIIDSNISPSKEIYYLGSVAIELLVTLEDDVIEVFDFFELFKIHEKVTMNLFLLVLDWLFILDLIDNKNGVIKKCF